MSGRKKIILAFISIFVLGIVTGVALAPPILNKLVGNPYSDDLVARRVFNVHFLNTTGMLPEKEKLMNDIVAKYVSQYMVTKDKFNDQRFNLYAAFTSELKNVLSNDEYNTFIANSENSMREREKYHKEKENEWHKERDRSRYYNKDYEEAARRMYNPRIPEDTRIAPITPREKLGIYNGDPDDLYQNYMFDKQKNGWGTFDKSKILKHESE